MDYSSIKWNRSILELRNLDNDQMLLIKTSKGVIDLYVVQGNLKTDVSFKLMRVRDAKGFVLENFSDATYTLI